MKSDKIQEELSKLITEWVKYKRLLKQVSNTKEQIVAYMKDNSIEKMECANGYIRISKSVQESFDEEKLIMYLQENYPQAIKMVPQIDYEYLNNIAYKDKNFVVNLIPFKIKKESARVFLHEN